METDEEEVFLPLATMLHLKCDDIVISKIKTDESPEVLNTPSLLLQNESQTDNQTDGYKQEINCCRVCLMPGSISSLPTTLRDTYWSLCNAGIDDQSSMPEPALCVVCRRLLYNAHNFKELCRAAHDFLTQKFDSDQFENMSENLRELFYHPNLTTIIQNFDNFNIKHESVIFDDVNEYRPKAARDAPKVARHAPKVTREAPKVTREEPKVKRVAPKVKRVASKVTRGAPKVRRIESIPVRSGPTLKKNVPEGVNNKKEVPVDIEPISSHDNSSDTDCYDNDDKDIFEKEDLEIISSHVNTLVPKAERRKTIVKKNDPEGLNIPNNKKEVSVDIEPISSHDNRSDTDYNDNDDKDIFENGNLEIISSNVTALVAKAERKKTIASRIKNTTTTTQKKKNTCLRKKSPAVQRKATDSEKTKKVKTKSVTVPKEKGHDQKIFEEYIDTVPLTLEDQKKNMELKMMSLNYKNARFRCDICYKIFLTEVTHNRHMECHSDKMGEHVCNVCYIHFPTRRRLSNHYRCHMHLFTCKVCSFTFNRRMKAHLHILSHRGITYSCEHCNITYNHNNSYLNHMRIHHPASNACQLCGYSFLSEKGVAHHKSRMHRFDDRPIPDDGPVCSKCNIKFVDKDSLITHLKVSPCANNRRVLNCKSESRRLPKELVQRSRQSSTVTCEKCNLKLESFNQYKQHFVEKHPNETMTQHSQGPQILCVICGKMFVNLTRLGLHMPTHGTADNFKCDECGRIYKSKAGLYFHKKKHEGVTFPCKVCKREFTKSCNRDRHYKYTHTELEFVKCDYCDKEFKSDLLKGIHMKHVHMNVPYKKRDRKRKREGEKAKFNKTKTEDDVDE